MLFFPQLATGATAQYPITKERIERTIQNISEDGTVISLYDIYASQIRWTLSFQSITDSEADQITSFFQTCEGSLQPFLFVDPTANLLLHSQDLTQTSWILSSLIQIAPGIEDPFGGTAATQLTNKSQAPLPVTQSVQVPGQYSCAFSVYLRSESAPCTITLSRGDGNNVASQAAVLSAQWNRFYLSCTFASSQSAVCQFSLIVPADVAIDVFGFQVDAQPLPGSYLTTTSAAACYPASRFDMDQVTVVSTAPSQSNLTLTILSQASN